MQWYLEALKKYAVFSGRARRKEYWYFVLFNIVISFVIGFVEGFTGVSTGPGGWGPISLLYDIAVLVPSIAVGVRRMHDTDRSGWWLLVSLVPVIGWILVIIWLSNDSQKEANEYGPNPKASTLQT